jgi:dTDP-4-amino-4,6-dideoxygalactose transaminase
MNSASNTIEFVDLKAQYRRLKPEIDRRIQAVLDHARFIMGPEVAELEKALADYAGCRYAVSCSSGTDALLMVLMAEGVGPGDAVFLPAFTFTATAEVVQLIGATPVFVDVDGRNFNIDLAHLEATVEATAKAGRLRPRVVVPVDLFGLPADYARLNALADRHDLFILADAAQSFSGAIGNRRVGTLAPATATSFFPAKPFGGYGDGGAVFTDDDGRAEVLQSIRAHGKGGDKYDIIRLGLNARLDTLQAAILLPKLALLDEERAARQKLADFYDSQLADVVATPVRMPDALSAWAQYSILVDERDRVVADLKRQGVPTAVYYPLPMHLQTAYRRFGNGEDSLPVSESLSKRILSLPMHPYMSPATAQRITDAVRVAVAGHG